MDKETVAKVAHLARLDTTENEQNRLAGELSQIFEWIDQLGEVNTDNVAPLTSALPHDGHWREDVANDGNDAARVLKNAPATTEGYYVVPKVIEGE